MKILLKNILLTFLILHNYCFSRHYVYKKPNMQVMNTKNFINFFPSTKKIDCFDKMYFEYPLLSLDNTLGHSDFDFKGYLEEIFLLELPYGKVLFDQSYCFVNNIFIKEIAAKNGWPPLRYNSLLEKSVPKVNGTVVVLYHPCSSMYGHYILDILGMLAVLEMKQIKYDFICLPYNKSFMKELLELWGIPGDKIMGYQKNYGFIADSVIISTNVSRDQKLVKYVNYYHPEILNYIRNKILNKIDSLNIDMSNFSKKIFLSRKDACYRNIPNEDEIFNFFEAKGFKRYEASKLSVIEQITLFRNATHIVGATGSNMTNILFSQPGTHFLTFIQNWADRTFYIIACLFGLKYYAICDTTKEDLLFGVPELSGRSLDIKKVEYFLNEHSEF